MVVRLFSKNSEKTMTNENRGRVYSFGAFRVDAGERLLFKGDREIPLTPKVFDTLLALIENSSHVLTKKELMQKVWPDSFVERMRRWRARCLFREL